jgi:diadenylate cyclase
MIARNPMFKIFTKPDETNDAQIIADSAFELSQQQHGALIVLVRSTGIRGYTETGEILNARLTRDLLTSIFYPRSPLHDGAVIVKNNVIEAARATLPLSNTTKVDGESLGMRHRAGLGISEQADVISIIISEETGSISIAENGELSHGLSKDSLKNRIESAFKTQPLKGWKAIIDQLRKQK